MFILYIYEIYKLFFASDNIFNIYQEWKSIYHNKFFTSNFEQNYDSFYWILTPSEFFSSSIF